MVETIKNVVVGSVNLQDSRPISIQVFVTILAWTNFYQLYHKKRWKGKV